MGTQATIRVESDKATLEMANLKATDTFEEHGSREATILYLFKLATMNGATLVQKVIA